MDILELTDLIHTLTLYNGDETHHAIDFLRVEFKIAKMDAGFVTSIKNNPNTRRIRNYKTKILRTKSSQVVPIFF